jgi:hypothetical protein
MPVCDADINHCYSLQRVSDELAGRSELNAELAAKNMAVLRLAIRAVKPPMGLVFFQNSQNLLVLFQMLI